MFFLIYHKFLYSISKVKMPIYTTGSGIYDRKVIEFFIKIKDPYPYLRGLAAEMEDEIKLIKFINVVPVKMLLEHLFPKIHKC